MVGTFFLEMGVCSLRRERQEAIPATPRARVKGQVVFLGTSIQIVLVLLGVFCIHHSRIAPRVYEWTLFMFLFVSGF